MTGGIVREYLEVVAMEVVAMAAVITVMIML